MRRLRGASAWRALSGLTDTGHRTKLTDYRSPTFSWSPGSGRFSGARLGRQGTIGRHRRSPEQQLRVTAVVFLVAVAVHGVDHARRGLDVVTTQVTLAGSIQFLLAGIGLGLVFRRAPRAPLAA